MASDFHLNWRLTDLKQASQQYVFPWISWMNITQATGLVLHTANTTFGLFAHRWMEEMDVSFTLTIFIQKETFLQRWMDVLYSTIPK
jgi:hypothetical protein